MKTFNFIYDFNTNFFHFVDNLSNWSPYTNKEGINLYSLHEEITKEDKKQLENYALFRKELEWENEINLFWWAYEEFTYDAFLKYIDGEYKYDKKEIYEGLKKTIDYFKTKANVYKVLEEKFFKLSEKIDLIKNEANFIEEKLSRYNKILNIFGNSKDIYSFPIFIFFEYNKIFSQGAANGEGIYTEFNEDVDIKQIQYKMGTIIHELLHKITNVEKIITEYVENNSQHFSNAVITEKGIDVSFLYERETAELVEEVKVFEEIIMYLISDVYIRNRPIDKTIESYKHEMRNKNVYRIWVGVKYFKPIFDKFLSDSIEEDEFMNLLVEIFIKKIYYKNFRGVE